MRLHIKPWFLEVRKLAKAGSQQSALESDRIESLLLCTGQAIQRYFYCGQHALRSRKVKLLSGEGPR